MSRGYRKGDVVSVAVHGAGFTTYEDHEVLRVSKGRVFLVDLRYPFDAETGKCLDPDSTMFGFRFILGEGATE